MKIVYPKYTGMSRRTIMSEKLHTLYQSRRQDLQERLTKVENCCITTDLWTSKATMGYMYITVTSADMNVANTTVNIASALKKVKDEWNITEIIQCAVTYSASNMKNAQMESFMVLCTYLELDRH